MERLHFEKTSDRVSCRFFKQSEGEMSSISMSFSQTNVLVPYSVSYCRATAIVQALMQSESLRSFYNQTNHLHWGSSLDRWSIEWMPSSREPFSVEYDFSKRIIVLHPDMSDDEAFSFFVYGLIHVSAEERFISLWNLCFNQEIGIETFVQRIEQIEHEKIRLHHELISQAILMLRLSPSIDFYAHETAVFAEYWNRIKGSSHAEYYRKKIQQVVSSFKGTQSENSLKWASHRQSTST